MSSNTLETQPNLMKSEEGAITAEYAIATLGGVAFAGLLVLVMRSDAVKDILFGLIARALGLQ
ncbi:DUF4244 domain-containing protein [Aquiluna borgnonia]|uniref:DUF4244 domain-containing protein n=1 Tax=Aquiluna borgnonia TaxID=2499157 RepID=A0A7D4TKV3_9MICO|nr:DUF4244 domain-containing protein [Aquiluna borgnonia]QKJ25632.1 DUF4244 domain-containing protein [Aquiluna borgnonia]